ncbi:hypothetical protein BTA51_22965 [Hahella sp. CCB-MM4]|nr:hypothetical protein BTA51_22965 [Hahella sp. CCB-MM4]
MLFVGCAQVPVSPEDAANVEEFSRFHRQQAQQLIDSGSYYQALIHVEILAMVDQGNGRYRKNIRELWERIRSRKQKLLEQSQVAGKKGDVQKAYQLLLTALSLDPEDTSLLPLLRKHYSAELRGEQRKKQAIYAGTRNDSKTQDKQDKKTSQVIPVTMPSVAVQAESSVGNLRELFLQGKYQSLISEAESSGLAQGNSEVTELLVKSHLALAKLQRSAGELEKAAYYAVRASAYQTPSTDLENEQIQIRKDVALALLEEGKSLLRIDLERAVHILEKAKELDNQDGGIQLALERAYRLKDNLSRIKGGAP